MNTEINADAVYGEVKQEAYDLIDRKCPFFTDDIRVSAVNRIAEFVHGLVIACGNAQKFIEDPHDGMYGVVLEFWNAEKKSWIPCEMKDGAILRNVFDFDDYADEGLNVGLYANWGECCGDGEGDDWDYRLGVEEQLPTEGNPEDVYAQTESCGGCGSDGEWYRLRRVPLGPFSDKAKKWMRENVHLFKAVKDARCGEV